MKGSGMEIGQLPRVECTMPDCNRHFNSVREMKQHKVADPTHFYCKKCDVDCENWEDLTRHKVDLMAPWLDSRRRPRLPPPDPDNPYDPGDPPQPPQPKHIVCEFCGQDFQSFGGRKAHRAQAHPADQDIQCPGCEQGFIRASHMVAHLERGDCDVITKEEFEGSVQHKHVRAQLMKGPQEVRENLRINHELVAAEEGPGLLALADFADGEEDEEDGGVSLLDAVDEAQRGGYKPLKAKVNLVDVSVPLTRSNVETWPRAPGLPPSQLTFEALNKLSLQNSTNNNVAPSQGGTEVTSRRGGIKVYTAPSQDGTEVAASDVTSRGGGVKIHSDFYPPLGSSSSARGRNQSITTSPASPRPSAWSNSNTTQTLFKPTISTHPPPPPPGDWSGFLVAANQSSTSTNLFYSRFYDSTSADYNPMRFYHSLLKTFCCPFPDCGVTYPVPEEIEEHLRDAHMKTHWRCDCCKRIFKSASALVGHVESTRKCGVRDGKSFKDMLDNITGGFLKARLIDEPKIYRAEEMQKAVAIRGTGKPTGGVASVAFQAKMPDQW